MGGRLSRQRGGGAGRGASPSQAGAPSSRHFRLTAPRPSVISHSTVEDQQQVGGGGGPRHSSSSTPRRGHAVSRRGSGVASVGGARKGDPGRDSSGQYGSSHGSRQAATGSSSMRRASVEGSNDDADGIDGACTPLAGAGGAGTAQGRCGGAPEAGACVAAAFSASTGGKKGPYYGGLDTAPTSAVAAGATHLHVPGLRGSSKRQISSNSERSRSTGGGSGGGGGKGTHNSTPPLSPRQQEFYSVVTDAYGEGENASGSRCRSAPPTDAGYNNRYTDKGGQHGQPGSGYTGAASGRPQGGYPEDLRNAPTTAGGGGGGKRCVPSPGGAGGGGLAAAAVGGATARGVEGGLLYQHQTARGGGRSPKPAGRGGGGRGAGDSAGYASSAGGGTGGGGGAAGRPNVVRRPQERGQRPEEDQYYYGGGGNVPPQQQQQERRKSSGGAAALPATSKVDKSGIIDRSKFILENVGVLTDFYDIDSGTLGQGSYGSVARARKKDTEQMRAIKTISKSQVKNLERFRQEIAIMKELDHPNVVKLFETFEDHRNIYLVMELCSGGELFDRIISEGRFTEKQAAVLMKQMLFAVHYLHSNHIMHRDLKPENFLFLDSSRDSPLKIIDFGLSCRFKTGEYVSTKAGTPYYVAPQVLQGKYDYRCDAWSLGVILYILLCGYPPFYGETDAEVLTKVKAGAYSFSGPEWKRVSEEARDLIRHLIKFNPQERYTAEQALQHPWITTLAQNSQNVALPTTLMSNLKAFRAQNKLKKAALTVIAQHMSEKDINHLRQIFMTLDVDNSGTLSVQEIREGLKRLGWTEIPLDLQAIIEEVDSDRSGHIDYTEFVAATMDKKLYMKEDVCWAAFRVFDLDGNGKISQDELKKVLGMPDVETAVGRATIDALLNEVDLNGDGEIDFEEFMHMMRKKDPPEKRFDSSTRKTVQPANVSASETMRRPTLLRPTLSTSFGRASSVAGSLPSTSAPAVVSSSPATTGAPSPLPAAAAATTGLHYTSGAGFISGCVPNASHPSRTLGSPSAPPPLEGDLSSRRHHAVG